MLSLDWFKYVKCFIGMTAWNEFDIAKKMSFEYRVTICICFIYSSRGKKNRNCIEQASCSDYGVSSTIFKD